MRMSQNCEPYFGHWCPELAGEELRPHRLVQPPPIPRSTSRLRANATCRASASLTSGTATIGTPRPVSSHNRPAAPVSVIPAAHLFTVLKVGGATTTASAAGNSSGSSGIRNAVRTRSRVSAASWADPVLDLNLAHRASPVDPEPSQPAGCHPATPA